MRPLFTLVIAIPLLTLLSCNNDKIGGSSAPDVDVSGFWLGTLTPDVPTVDNVEKYFQVTQRYEGSTPDDGSVTGDIRFCTSAGNFCVLVRNQNSCPERQPSWAGSIENSDMEVDIRGDERDVVELDIEYLDPDNAVGRYEYVESDGTCAGETGVLVMTRRNT